MTLSLLDRPASEPPIRDDVIRRTFLSGGAAVLVLSACGETPDTAESAAGPVPGPATRTISHAAGTTEVPVDPQRIVTLQDQNALLPLLELGVKPVASAGLVGDDGSETFRRTEGFDTSGIDFVGAYGEPNLEAIAAARPDLIVCDEFGAADVYDELSQIAPTVFVQVFERPLTEALADFAEVVGRQDQAEELHAAYEARSSPSTTPTPSSSATSAGESADPGVSALVESPLYANLAATRAEQSYVIDATRSVSSGPAMGVFLDELERILLDPAFDHDIVEEVA